MEKIKVEILEDTADNDGWYNTSVAGRKVLLPKGHPSIGILKYEESDKYGIINLSNMTATEPFLDKFYYCEDSLETWVENYVIGKIDSDYYIVDKEGNCFFKSELAYLICRNLIVQLNPKRRRINFDNYVLYACSAFCGYINSKLEFEDTYGERTFILNLGDYDFAFWQSGADSKMTLMNTLGELEKLNCFWTESGITVSGVTVPRIGEYAELLINEWIMQVSGEFKFVFLDKDFNTIKAIDGYRVKKVLSSATKSYMIENKNGGYCFYSYIYGFLDKWFKFGECEFFQKRGEDKYTIIKADGSVEYEDAVNEVNHFYTISSNRFSYRIDDEVIERDRNGEVIRREKLSARNLCMFDMLETIINILRKDEK